MEQRAESEALVNEPLLKNMDLTEKEWDEAKQFGQYMLENGEAQSEAVVEFRRQDLAAYLGMLSFHKGSDDVQLDAAKSAAAIAWGWLWHVTTADDRVKTARHLLGQMLDKDLKRYGIQTAKIEGAQVNVQEIEAAMLRGEFGDA